MNKKLLIVEDQFIEANNLRLILQKAEYTVLPIARTVPEALSIIAGDEPDLVLLDIQLKTEQTGIDLARMLKIKGIAFIFLSANADEATFNEAKQTGPYGFLVKPFRERDVLAMLDIAESLHQQHLALSSLKVSRSTHSLPAPADAFYGIIGKTAQIQEIIRYINIAAATEFPALILGESGTGKELVAKAIHKNSKRGEKPLVVVDCAALPDHLVEAELFGYEKGSFTGALEKRSGKFEQADGGTIFLDEIGELPLEMQVKFLRVLQEMEISPIGGKRKKVNVRIIAATHRNLEAEVAAGRFRLDLYYRLNVFPIEMPALRDRRDDILLLAEHFLAVVAKKENKNTIGFSEEVKKRMLDHSWPGNLRELENQITRAILLSDQPLITNLLLSKAGIKIPKQANGIKTITDNERDHILAALAHCNWKIYGHGGAAELLAINGSTLKSRMNKLGITKAFNSVESGLKKENN